MNKLVSDGSVKKINYPVLYESGITPPLCEVSAPEPDAGGKRIVAYVYKSSRNTVFENPDIVKTCTVRDLKNDFVKASGSGALTSHNGGVIPDYCDEKGEGQ
ncbi:conjugal transfer protein TrbG [Escherichia coli]|uniref:Conjugal transfer protein TrbG n=9 Tax=Enterobacterales TaxID=91347 RepID=A0A8S0FFL0_ECOLX|nr:conjugal transfer protein TrbG [Escherichia coli]